MVNVNKFIGLNDNERLENAIKNRTKDGIVVIPPRESEDEPERDYWLLDRAILLPENTTIILQNCMIKLSDHCRDNFFRSANCGLGIEDPERIYNIHIRGEGICILQGADNPRSTGDSSKILANPCPYYCDDILALADWISEESRQKGEPNFTERHNHTYGTDAGKENESQFGDWRNIGILLANVENFSIENVRIVCSHGWGISLEACAYGYLHRIDFDCCMSKVIDGVTHNIENQDGIDVRNGCHDITISDITGETGDDVVALTAIASPKYHTGGSLRSTHVMHNDWTRRDPNIRNVTIRNVRAYSSLCYLVRLLPCECYIQNVVVDGVIDTSPSDVICGGMFLGEKDTSYGKNLQGSLRNIAISNVIYNNVKKTIRVDGYLEDSAITNVIAMRTKFPVVSVLREGGLKNVKISNIVSSDDKLS